MIKLMIAVLAGAVISAAVTASDDDFDEFFVKEREILGGDPGSEKEYECSRCRQVRQYEHREAPEATQHQYDVRYSPQRAVRYERPAARQRNYRIVRSNSRLIWDPLLSDSAVYVIEE